MIYLAPSLMVVASIFCLAVAFGINAWKDWRAGRRIM